jgi:hypothetical protein
MVLAEHPTCLSRRTRAPADFLAVLAVAGKSAAAGIVTESNPPALTASPLPA